MRQAFAAVPAPAHVTPDRRVTLVGRTRGRVPEMRVVEQDVSPVAIERDLARDLLEAERDLRAAPAMAPRNDAEEPVGGRRGVEVDRERDRRPDLQMGPGLEIGVPADARVRRADARPGVLVHDPEALVVEQVRLRPQQAAHDLGDDGDLAGAPRRLRHLGDMADVVRERLAVDDGVRAVEHHGAAAVGKPTRDELALAALELGLEVGERLIGIHAAEHREAMLGEELDHRLLLAAREDAYLARERGAGRRSLARDIGVSHDASERRSGRDVAVRPYDRGVRVVSLLPSATEIVFALGCGDDLVGVTFECDHPPEARTRRVVSTSNLPEGLSPSEIDAEVSARIAAGEDLYRLDQDALATLDADVVLTQDLCAVCAVDLARVDDALEYLGCTAEVVTLDPRRLEEVLTSIETVADVLGVPDRAAALVRALRLRLDTTASALAGVAPRPVLVLEWTDPAFSAGHWVPDLVTAGGGVPVLANVGGDSRRVDWDQVVGASAEVVVVAPCGYHLDAAFGLAEELVRAGRVPAGAEVWAVDADSHFVRPGPRVVDGVETMARIVHPAHAGPVQPDRARLVTP